MKRALRSLWVVLATSFHVSPRQSLLSFLEAGGALLDAVRPVFIAWMIGGVVARDAGQMTFATVGFIGSIALEQVLNQVGINARIKQLERVGGEFDFRVAELTAGIHTLEHLESPAYLDQLQTLRDQEGVLGVALNKLLNGVTGAVRFIGVIAVVAGSDWRLLLVGVAAVPSVLATGLYARWRGKAEDQAAPHGRLASHLMRLSLDPDAGAETRVFGLERFTRARLRAAALAWRRPFVHQSAKQAALEAVGSLIFFGTAAAVIAAILRDVLQGTRPLEVLVIALVIVTRLQTATLGVLEAVGGVSTVIRTAGRFLWLVEHGDRAVLGAGTEDVPGVGPAGIVCDNVSYAYPESSSPALRDVTLRLEPGTVVAVVGENGAGKSTLAAVLTGMYRPSSGRLTLSGADLASLDIHKVRRRMSGAFQDFATFEFVAQEAVGAGDLERYRDESSVREAVKRGAAEGLIDSLPNGLATQLGTTWRDGVGLSRGQWQRVALARGMMRRAPSLLVLDEPTAALDALAEQELFDRYSAAANHNRRNGAVTLLITHRFSTVRSADRIIVMDSGRIVEDGTHEELLEAQGLYAELYELQARGYR